MVWGRLPPNVRSGPVDALGELPLTELMVIWACSEGMCSKVYAAYKSQNSWIGEIEGNAERFGKQVQRQYIPDYIEVAAVPVIGALYGQGEIKLGGGNSVVIDLRRSALQFKYSF